MRWMTVWFEVMTLEHVQNEPGLIVHSWRKPPRQQPDTMPFQGVHLGIEAWDMLGAIIVGEELETQSLQHGGAFLWAALLRIERHNTPGN